MWIVEPIVWFYLKHSRYPFDSEIRHFLGSSIISVSLNGSTSKAVEDTQSCNGFVD